MKLYLCLLASLPTLMFSGCATEPVADLLKRNGGFVQIRPPSDSEYLGDVYRGKNLIEKSIGMKDVMEKQNLDAMMASRAKQVSIESTSGSSSFKLSAEAAYVGIASGDLQASGAAKYSVTVSKPVIYDSELDGYLAPVLIPSIKSRFPNV